MERIAQCSCGLLHATTQGEPVMVGICHCKACQRQTGALAGNVAGFARAQVEIKGDSNSFDRRGDSGRNVRFHFCPHCGSSLYWEADGRPEWVFLAVGAFADPSFPPPSVSIFEASKHDWLQLPTGIKRFQGAFTSDS